MIFVDGAQSEDTLLVSVDGSTGEHTWFYFPPDDIFFKDFYSAGWGENLVSRLLEAETVVITVPTGDNDYVITFDVAGLDQHIDVPQDLCEG